MVEKEFIKGKAPFSEGIKVGNTIFVSGQIPKAKNTGIWPATIEGQTKTCLDRISTILEKVDANMGHIVKTTVYLTSMNDYAKMNSAYTEYFKNLGIAHLPVRSCVEVGKLMFEEWFIEIDAIAMIDQ